MLRTMIVDSLARPGWLARPEQQKVYSSQRLEGEALREAQDDAVLLALRDQETAGLDIVTDGEQRRRHYIWGFCEGLGGLDFERLVKLEACGNRGIAAISGLSRRKRLYRTMTLLPDARFYGDVPAGDRCRDDARLREEAAHTARVGDDLGRRLIGLPRAEDP